MTNKPASKERRQYHTTTLLPHHDACPNLITGKFICGKIWNQMTISISLQLQPCSFRLPLLCTKDSLSNKSTKYECWSENNRQFQLCKVSNIRSHSHATANQHLRCSKERKQDTKEDKGKSMMHP